MEGWVDDKIEVYVEIVWLNVCGYIEVCGDSWREEWMEG